MNSSTGKFEINQPIFPQERLEQLKKWNELKSQLEDRGLYARPLKFNDFDNGYLELLTQLTTVGQVSRLQFENRFKQIQNINSVSEHYAIVVIVDKSTDKIVAASTLFLEYKFIHQCTMRGRLEDVAVLDTYRGKQIGELVVRIIIELAREAYKCYKLTLDCTDNLKKFYAKNNFSYGSNMLSIRFE